MLNGSIYVIKNKCNNKVYIGQTTQRVEERFKQHLKLLKTNSKQLIHKAIKKYGKENFYYEVLVTNISSLEELNKLEEDFIKKYNSLTPNGYNLCLGGNQPRNSKAFSLEEEKCMVDKYKNGYSTRKIAEEYGISRLRVSNILRKNNCELRSKNWNLEDRTSKITKEILIQLFIEQKKSTKEIASILNVSDRTIRRRISIFRLREYNTEN